MDTEKLGFHVSLRNIWEDHTPKSWLLQRNSRRQNLALEHSEL
jgi:hypothetical protein